MDLTFRIIVRSTAAAVISMLTLSLAACNEEPIPVETNYVVVFEGSGKLQRESFSGVSPQQSGLRLIRQGLDVRRSGCGVMTNVAFPPVCGGMTGDILLHEISLVSLDVAERIGFRSVGTLQNGYAWVDCESGRPLP